MAYFTLFRGAAVALVLATVAQLAAAADETRPVGSFEAVSLRGPFKLVLRQAAREAVQVSADAQVLPLVETRVVTSGGLPTLEIATRRGAELPRRAAVTVTVDVASLSALTVAGSGEAQGDALTTKALRVVVAGAGDVKLGQLGTDSLAIKISGSGNVHAGGRSAKLAVDIAGSGDVDTTGLQSDEVAVGIAGSGDAKVDARKTLAVSIAGSGDVVYRGDATLTTSIAGSGRVRRQ